MLKLKNSLDKKTRSVSQSPVSKRALIERTLRPSCGTLIIVPLVLLEHWYEQLSRHIGLQYLSENFGDYEDNTGRGVIFIDGLGDIVDVEAPLPKLSLGDSLNASDEVLANYLFVITTFERCEALHESRIKLRENQLDGHPFDAKLFQHSNALLSVRWLRLVVDEGHEIANQDNNKRKSRLFFDDEVMSSSAAFICEISAERRWVMTGTPTTGTSSVEALMQLQKLFGFLRHAVFGVPGGKELWNDRIVKPYLARNPHSWELLISNLKATMIRHTKVSISVFIHHGLTHYVN